MFTVSPKQAAQEIVKTTSVGLVPYITSSPGVGKSSVFAQVAKEYNLKLIDLRLPQCTPEDLQGFPMRQGDKATFTPFDLFPIEGDPIPEGYDGWMLFLDELSSASKPVQAAAYKLILDRMVGSHKLHENVVIGAAGNKQTDKAVTVQMSTALQSRLIHYEMEVSLKDWMEWATLQDLDHRILGFMNFNPSGLMNFRPDHQDHTFACPRTWEFLSRLIKDEPVDTSIGARVAGTIGQGMSAEFITFAEEYTRIPKLSEIVGDPKGTNVPREASTKYAIISMLMQRHTEENIAEIISYVTRFDVEFQIVFARGVNLRNPKLRGKNKSFADFVLSMVKYM